MMWHRNRLRTAVGAAALVAVAISGITACGSTGSNVLIVSGEPSPTPVPTTAAAVAPSEPTTAPERSQPSDEADPTPEGLSTGPALEWTEFDLDESIGPDTADINRIDSVGDGRVLAQIFDLDGPSRAMVSENGTDWNQLPLPVGIAPLQIDVAAPRWLVTGWDTANPRFGSRAFYSDDEGVSWTEMVFDLGDPDLRAGIITAVAAQEQTVLAVQSVPLIEDEDDDANAMDSIYVKIFFSDGGPFEHVAEYPGWGVNGYSSSDGFQLLLLGVAGDSLLTSPDGRQWSESSSDLVGERVGGSPMGTVWTGIRVEGEYRLERFDRPELAVAIPEEAGYITLLAAGPAGLAAMAQPGLSYEPGVLQMPEFTFAQDGYELRYNEPEGGITLWNLSEETAVYELGPEALMTDTSPKGVREEEGEGGVPALLIFEDPETGEDLVAFDMMELGEAMIEAGELDQPNETGRSTEQWVGWSANGTDWGWQTISDAFNLPALGADEAGYSVGNLAVGKDFVIANVLRWRTSGSDSAQSDSSAPSPDSGDGDYGESSSPTGSQPPRWYIAKVG